MKTPANIPVNRTRTLPMPMLRLPHTVVVLSILAGLGGTSLRADDFDLFKPGFGDGPDILAAPPGKAVFSAKLESTNPQPGGEAVLSVTVELPRGYYISSTAKSNPVPTLIPITASSGLEPIDEDWTADHPPKLEVEKSAATGEIVDVEKYTDTVTWSKRFRITDADGVFAELQIEGQYCSSRQCVRILGERHRVEFADEGSGPPTTFEHTETPTALGRPYPVTPRISLSPENAEPGDEVTLTVHMTIDDPWHVFSTTMPLGRDGTPTKITLSELSGLQPVDESFAADRAHEIEQGELGELEIFEHEVTWTRKYLVTQPKYGLAGSVRFASCKQGTCLPPTKVAFAIGHVSTEAPAVPQPAAPLKSEPVERAEPADPVGANVEDPRSKGLVLFLVAAAGAGFFALLTPCVFPMVPITVSFFLKQSEKEHSKPIALASVYALGIIGTFTILGLLMAAIYGATEVTRLANNPWLNLVLASVLIFFGASLLGMFEIRMPSWLVNWSSGKQSKGGYIGALFMSITFTLMSFTCTFAFAGLLLVWAAKGEYFWPILGMLAFSTAFALPFFVLALLPGLLKKMPQSGGWMNTIKVTMGMIEVGAAIKFLSIADYAMHPEPWFFDYHVVMVAWMVVAACTGAYLLGLFRLGHDTPTESISVPRLGFAMLFLCTATYLAVTLFSPRPPEGPVAETLAGLAPPVIHGGESKDLGPYVEHDGLQYALDVDKAIEYAKAENKPLFFDFTGVNCANCRQMEAKMARPENRKLLEKYVRVALFLDAVPEIKDADERKRILDRNTEIAVKELGLAGMPTYAVVEPNGEFIREVKPVGMEEYDGQFTEFLRDGLQAWERISARTKDTRLAERAQDNGHGPYMADRGHEFALDVDKAIEFAQSSRKPLLIEFSGIYSVNARLMDKRMYRPDNRRLLDEYVLVRLYQDQLPPELGFDAEEEDRLLARNRELSMEMLQDVALPSFVIVKPDGGYLEDVPPLMGFDPDPERASAFLAAGIDAWKLATAIDGDTSLAAMAE